MADTAEQTRVALPWQQGEARGTLNLPASTKVEDLKLCLNASDCAAVMFDAVIIEVRKGSSVLKRKLDTHPPFVKGRHTLMLTCTVCVILQAVILPCLERIVHSIGIELLSIFFLGVFAIALKGGGAWLGLDPTCYEYTRM